MALKNKLVRRWLLGVILGTVLLGGWVTIGSCLTGYGCPYDSTYLPALREDPMASYQPPGTELTGVEYRAQGHSWWTGGSASIQRRFRILEQDHAEKAVAEAIGEAESNAWIFNSRGRGCKRLPPGTAIMRVSLDDDRTTPDPADLRLQIRLSFPPGVPSCGS